MPSSIFQGEQELKRAIKTLLNVAMNMAVQLMTKSRDSFVAAHLADAPWKL
jgi:hypothetical protein